MTGTCARCHGVRWVCENHPGRPWAAMTAMIGEPSACGCGAGEPCRDCSPLAPQMLADRNRWYWSGPSAEERRMLRLVRRSRGVNHWGSDGPSVLCDMRRRRR